MIPAIDFAAPDRFAPLPPRSSERFARPRVAPSSAGESVRTRDGRELVLRLKAILRRAGPTDAGQRITTGLLTLDTGSHRAWVEGQSLELTALEFKLLHQFMARPGRVQSREQLLADVWGITSPLETRTVDTHVMRLREKLGPARNSVETVRGVGYRMTDESAAARA